MGRCKTCGTNLGFFSFADECNTCKQNRLAKEAAEKEKLDAEKVKLQKYLADHIQQILITDSIEKLPTLSHNINDPREKDFTVKIQNNVLCRNPIENRRYS